MSLWRLNKLLRGGFSPRILENSTSLARCNSRFFIDLQRSTGIESLGTTVSRGSRNLLVCRGSYSSCGMSVFFADIVQFLEIVFRQMYLFASLHRRLAKK